MTPKVGSTKFGDVHVCGTGTSADGSTVRQLLSTSNSLLSFGPLATISDHAVHLDEWAQVKNWLTYSDSDGDAPVK